jgi:rhodanese-related sulfurtransferase
MERKYSALFSLILIIFLLVAGCNGNKKDNSQTESGEVQKTEAVVQPVTANPVVIGTETELLLKDLKENGDYVNSKEFPSLIKASIVNGSLGKNILVIDLRSQKDFADGHIKGAVNKNPEDLPAYFETGIKPFEFEKIIMVSEDGQVSSYVTCLLKGLSGKYETNLESTVTERPVSKGMPEIKTGFQTGQEIGAARFSELFKEGAESILISADEVFSNPAKYYIINLERKDKYEDGHIPGAVRYKPEATLGFIEEMASIPAEKPVVIYCGTGHNSGFATAYLRLFGYDAYTLKYGNNSFMYDKMVKQKATLSWLPFTTADVNDFEVVK